MHDAKLCKLTSGAAILLSAETASPPLAECPLGRRILYAKAVFDEEKRNAVAIALDNSLLSSRPNVKRFEARVAALYIVHVALRSRVPVALYDDDGECHPASRLHFANRGLVSARSW